MEQDICLSVEEVVINWVEPNQVSDSDDVFSDTGSHANISDKLYRCEFCSSGFKQKLHLNGHLLNKHGDRPNIEKHVTGKVHRCRYCRYRTVNKYNLDRHGESKHGAKSKVPSLKCEFCPYTTKNKGNLSLHARRHANGRKFKCECCPKTFCQKANLHVHILKKHSDQLGDKLEQIVTSKIYKCHSCRFLTLDKQKYANHLENH